MAAEMTIDLHYKYVKDAIELNNIARKTET
jgi:hypothetical protein